MTVLSPVSFTSSVSSVVPRSVAPSAPRFSGLSDSTNANPPQESKRSAWWQYGIALLAMTVGALAVQRETLRSDAVGDVANTLPIITSFSDGMTVESLNIFETDVKPYLEGELQQVAVAENTPESTRVTFSLPGQPKVGVEYRAFQTENGRVQLLRRGDETWMITTGGNEDRYLYGKGLIDADLPAVQLQNGATSKHQGYIQYLQQQLNALEKRLLEAEEEKPQAEPGLPLSDLQAQVSGEKPVETPDKKSGESPKKPAPGFKKHPPLWRLIHPRNPEEWSPIRLA